MTILVDLQDTFRKAKFFPVIVINIADHLQCRPGVCHIPNDEQ